MSDSFAHLHLHTEFSMLDGAARVQDVVARAAELGQPAVAITDHGVLYGVVDFYQAAKSAGINRYSASRPISRPAHDSIDLPAAKMCDIT